VCASCSLTFDRSIKLFPACTDSLWSVSAKQNKMPTHLLIHFIFASGELDHVHMVCGYGNSFCIRKTGQDGRSLRYNLDLLIRSAPTNSSIVTYDHIAESRRRLVTENGDKVATNRLILSVLLTQPSRVSLQVFGYPSVRAHDHLGGTQCDFLEIHSLTALMRSPHK
jgi:hypothetical protein